jgi:elongation factor G
MSVSTTDLRNIAIIGHNGTGKTTLLEHILFQRGLISRAETIESGKTTSDYTEEEIAKQISIHTSMVQFDVVGRRMQDLKLPVRKRATKDI